MSDWQLDQRRARVIRAATDWVYDRSPATEKELEDAVTDLTGTPIGQKPPSRYSR